MVDKVRVDEYLKSLLKQIEDHREDEKFVKWCRKIIVSLRPKKWKVKI